MLRSMTIFSSTVAITLASDVGSSSTPDVVSAAVPQQKQLWYPTFATDYESGSCTTTPSPALLAFNAGAPTLDEDDDSESSSSLVHESKASCCDAWFSEQEGCGCLGGCPSPHVYAYGDDESDENDAAPTLSMTAEPLSDVAEEATTSYWYPQFDLTYDAGKCVKAGVNTNELPPSYYTLEGGFLHTTIDGCCNQWFAHQESKSCMSALGEFSMTSQPGVNSTATTFSSSAAGESIIEAATSCGGCSL